MYVKTLHTKYLSKKLISLKNTISDFHKIADNKKYNKFNFC